VIKLRNEISSYECFFVDVLEQGAEENMKTQQGGSNRKMEETA
jgi:hypothetical protein